MTLREYIEENVCDIVAELCQYQRCDNCSIASLYGYSSDICPLQYKSVEDVIDEDISDYEEKEEE